MKAAVGLESAASKRGLLVSPKPIVRGRGSTRPLLFFRPLEPRYRKGDEGIIASCQSRAEAEAIRARVLDERPYPEIAAELQTSELVIRKRLSRGLATLREELEKEERP